MFGARFTACLNFAVNLGSALAEPLLVVSIVTAPTPGQAAQHRIAKIIAALKDKQVSFETVNSQDAAKGKMLIVAGLASEQKQFHETAENFLPVCSDERRSAGDSKIQQQRRAGLRHCRFG